MALRLARSTNRRRCRGPSPEHQLILLERGAVGLAAEPRGSYRAFWKLATTAAVTPFSTAIRTIAPLGLRFHVRSAK